MRALLTVPSTPPHVAYVRTFLPAGTDLDVVETGDEDDLARHAAEAEVFLVGLRPITAEIIARAPRLRLIQRLGVGYDNVDVVAARAAGILVACTPGANAVAVAEHTIMLMLALLKRLPVALEGARMGRWAPSAVVEAGVGDLAGATIGLIGFGSIGRAVAERLIAFGPRLLYTARRAATTDAQERLGVTYVALDELLASCSMVSLHLPLNGQTRALIDDRALALMPRGALLINTSRGGLIDEAAVRRAIEQGRLGGAALDVLQDETDGGNPFGGLPQVIVTPHIASASHAGSAGLWRFAGANMARLLAGEPLAGLVPPSEDPP